MTQAYYKQKPNPKGGIKVMLLSTYPQAYYWLY